VADQVQRDLERRFSTALREAVQEAYQKDTPKLAQALLTAGEFMRRSESEILRQLEEIGVYSWTPEQREMMVRVLSQQMVRDAKVTAEREAQSLWGTWQAKVGIIVGIGGFVILVLNQIVSLATKVH
jgi:hypothetical protein